MGEELLIAEEEEGIGSTVFGYELVVRESTAAPTRTSGTSEA
jgi:hypothetical protein